MPAPFNPTPEQRLTVKLHKLQGTPDELICRVITNPKTKEPITKPTLYKYFRDELDLGKLEIDTLCVGKLVAAIKNGEAWAICFYAKAQMGWSERTVNEHRHSGNISTATDAELESRLAELLGKTGAAGAAGGKGAPDEDSGS